MKVAILALCLFICSTVFYLSTNAQQSQIRSCRRITACRTAVGTNSAGMSQCTTNYSYEGCDGTIPGARGRVPIADARCRIVCVHARVMPRTSTATASLGETVTM